MIILDKPLKKKIFNLFLSFFSYKFNNIFIHKGSSFACNAAIGTGTRTNGKLICKGFGFVNLGRYCAIGNNITILTSNHSMHYLSIQLRLQKDLSGKVFLDDKMNCEIGNDVWIGDGVTILPGVKIQDGCVIGAGSVVTKSFSPYSVIAGVPAKLLKMRFKEETVRELMELKWWNWGKDKIKANKHLFSKKLDTDDCLSDFI